MDRMNDLGAVRMGSAVTTARRNPRSGPPESRLLVFVKAQTTILSEPPVVLPVSVPSPAVELTKDWVPPFDGS